MELILIYNLLHFTYRFVAVVVVLGSSTLVKEAYNDAEFYTETASYYIAATWDETAIYSGQVMNPFVVGNGNIYVTQTPGKSDKISYVNIALISNQDYSIFVRYDIENEDYGGPHEVRVS